MYSDTEGFDLWSTSDLIVAAVMVSKASTSSFRVCPMAVACKQVISTGM
jgi:hypothetical protein